MFIQIYDTPNPNTLKFLPGIQVLKSNETATFLSSDDCLYAPMAKHLFAITGVKSVFLAGDFISVTKFDESRWDSLKPLVLSSIMDHYTAGYPVVLDAFYQQKSDTKQEVENEISDAIMNQIKEIIETKVRPAVSEDGGDIVFHDFKEGIVYLEMHGACAGCPSSTVTLKSGIERMLKHYIPEVISVEAI